MNRRFRQLLCALLVVICPGAAVGATMSVQSEKAAVRSSAGPFAPIVATLVYGDQVTVGTEQGTWVQVSTASRVSGWMQKSSLTTKKVVLQAGSQDVSRTASGEELALAGKGFNSSVEGKFKADNPNVDFKWIDYMDQIKISESQMVKFLREGGLKAGGAQ